MTAPLRDPDDDEPAEWREPGLEELSGLTDGPPDPPLDELVPYYRLCELQQPAWLVDGVIPASAVSTIFADPGVGKTFIVVSLAVAVSAGLPWGDRDCGEGGSVVLVIGEGLAGVPKRIVAAAKAAGFSEERLPIHVRTEPLNLMEPALVTRFIARVCLLDPPVRLVVFDTFITCTPGADQNSSTEMTVAFAQLKRIVRETGAAVVTTDHPNNTQKGRPAGSYSKVASADAIWQAERDGERIQFKATKLKDFERDTTEVVTLRLAKVAGTDSAALKHVDAVHAAIGGHELDKVCIDALAAVTLYGSATSSEWLATVQEAGYARASFYRGRYRLLRGHLVEEVGRRYRLTPGGQLLVSRDGGAVS